MEAVNKSLPINHYKYRCGVVKAIPIFPTIKNPKGNVNLAKMVSTIISLRQCEYHRRNKIFKFIINFLDNTDANFETISLSSDTKKTTCPSQDGRKWRSLDSLKGRGRK